MVTRFAGLSVGSKIAYEPQGAGLASAPLRDRLVVLLTRNLTFWPRSAAAHGANSAARRLGYGLISIDWQGSAKTEAHYLEQVLERKPAGAILLAPFETENLPLCKRLVSQIPTVQGLMSHPDLLCDAVVVDHYASGILAIEHLAELGYRRIGEVTYNVDLPNIQQWLQAYLDALQRANLPCEAQWILRLPGYWGWSRGGRWRRRCLLRRYLQSPQRPAAVVAFNDHLAAELGAVAWELGLTIPRDLAVVGAGDMPPYSLSGVPLTTLRYDYRRIGAVAVERLDARVRGEARGVPAEVRMPAQLIVRESSTGRVAAGNPWGRVREYLVKNFRKPLSAREVAQVAPFEANYFSRRFPKVFGKHFTLYLRDLRLDCARELLLTTDLTIEQIAERSGFHNPKYFFRVFKQTCGTTPHEYRAESSFLH